VKTYERVGTKGACRETIDGLHVVESGDRTCILCFMAYKENTLVTRRPHTQKCDECTDGSWFDASHGCSRTCRACNGTGKREPK
jgi:hypothetical protein